jgi:hypothetical protein
MDELTKLLEGSANDVKVALRGLSHDDLLKLKSAEQNGSKREGVLHAIDSALRHADTARTGGTVVMTGAIGIASALDTSAPADLAAASEFSPSGAARQVTDIDVDHPAVDNDPRANTTETMNRIDFNDPGKSGREAVDDALKARG